MLSSKAEGRASWLVQFAPSCSQLAYRSCRIRIHFLGFSQDVGVTSINLIKPINCYMADDQGLSGMNLAITSPRTSAA